MAITCGIRKPVRSLCLLTFSGLPLQTFIWNEIWWTTKEMWRGGKSLCRHRAELLRSIAALFSEHRLRTFVSSLTSPLTFHCYKPHSLLNASLFQGNINHGWEIIYVSGAFRVGNSFVSKLAAFFSTNASRLWRDLFFLSRLLKVAWSVFSYPLYPDINSPNLGDASIQNQITASLSDAFPDLPLQ